MTILDYLGFGCTPYQIWLFLYVCYFLLHQGRFAGLCCLLLLEEKAKNEHVRRYIWVGNKEMDEMNDNELLANICFAKYIPSS